MGAGRDDVSGVSIVSLVLAVAGLVTMAVAFLSALSAVWIVGWRAAFSGRFGLLQAPPGVDPAAWRHMRRFWMCYWGALACTILLQFLLFIRPSAM